MKRLANLIETWNCARCRLIRHAIMTAFLLVMGVLHDMDLVVAAGMVLAASTMVQARIYKKMYSEE